MPQLIVFALVGAGLYAGYKFARTQIKQASDAARRKRADDKASSAAGPARTAETLEWDAKAGVYRPSQRD